MNGTSVVTSGVADVPLAGANDAGVIKVNGLGLAMLSSGLLAISKASDSEVKAGSHNYSPIVPSQQGKAAFYGLAKAAGDSTQSASSNPVGTYTAEAKAAIQAMLGTGVEVVRLA